MHSTHVIIHNYIAGGSMSGHRSTKTYSMLLKGTPEQVFPLLCPVREYEWIDNWQCEVVYSDSGFAELDCVFKTRFPGDGPEDTWAVSRYEPPLLIEFVRVNVFENNPVFNFAEEKWRRHYRCDLDADLHRIERRGRQPY